jgi:hypothetical protein
VTVSRAERDPTACARSFLSPQLQAVRSPFTPVTATGFQSRSIGQSGPTSSVGLGLRSQRVLVACLLLVLLARGPSPLASQGHRVRPKRLMDDALYTVGVGRKLDHKILRHDQLKTR